MATLNEIKKVKESDVGAFIEEVMDLFIRTCDLDIGSEEKADVYDWLDGTISELVEQFFGICQASWDTYHVFKEINEEAE